jgi:hypothetical protein
MQLQPLEAYWEVQYYKVTRRSVEIVPGPHARNAYSCLVMCLYPLPVPCNVPSWGTEGCAGM